MSSSLVRISLLLPTLSVCDRFRLFLEGLDQRWKISWQRLFYASHHSSRQTLVRMTTRKKRRHQRQRREWRRVTEMKHALATVHRSKDLLWVLLKPTWKRPERASRSKWISWIWYILPTLSALKHWNFHVNHTLSLPAFDKALFLDLICSTFMLPHSAYSLKHPHLTMTYALTTSTYSSLSLRTFYPTV